jgi:hypothetical protein
MKIFKVFTSYFDSYQIHFLKMKVIANDEKEAEKNFINECSKDINMIRRYLQNHPALQYTVVVKINPCYDSFHEYYNLTYVNNEHNITYEDYLGYGKEYSYFTPSKKTQENYKSYLEYNKFWTDAYEKLEKYRNNEERQKEYEEYVKECIDFVDEENSTDKFILDFFNKLEIDVHEIKMNELEIQKIDRM